MAGYSGTPLAKKLGIKEGARVILLGAPRGFADELAPLPPGVTITTRLPKSGADVILLFAPSIKDLKARLNAAAAALAPTGGLWIGWLKKSSGIPTDLTEADVHQLGLATALVDNKVCAINDTWSGLRFVIRLANRKA